MNHTFRAQQSTLLSSLAEAQLIFRELPFKNAFLAKPIFNLSIEFTALIQAFLWSMID